MTQDWEPGTQYNDGDRVRYHGGEYKIIQPHRSQGDWTPDRTPALWGHLEGHHSGGGDGGNHNNNNNNNNNNSGGGSHNTQHPQNPPPNYNQDHHPAPSGTSVTQQGDHKAEITPETKKKHWYDLEDDDKKKLEVGGGLLAGAAALGAGYFAYKEHKKSGEEQKAQEWALSNWIRDATERRADYDRNGLRGPAQWVLNKGKDIPKQAIVVSKERDWNLYIARAFYEGGIHPGKASDAFTKGAVIGYGNDEIHLDTYEILVGDMRGLQWKDTSGRLNLSTLGARAVEGGREEGGTLIYIASAFHKDSVHPGKCSETMDTAVIPYGDGEVKIKQYRVLCYA